MSRSENLPATTTPGAYRTVVGFRLRPSPGVAPWHDRRESRSANFPRISIPAGAGAAPDRRSRPGWSPGPYLAAPLPGSGGDAGRDSPAPWVRFGRREKHVLRCDLSVARSRQLRRKEGTLRHRPVAPPVGDARPSRPRPRTGSPRSRRGPATPRSSERCRSRGAAYRRGSSHRGAPPEALLGVVICRFADGSEVEVAELPLVRVPGGAATMRAEEVVRTVDEAAMAISPWQKPVCQ